MRKIVSFLLMSQAAADPDDQVLRVWFEKQPEIGLDYNTIKSNCAARGAAIGNTVGFPAFFRNQAEYDDYLSSVSDDGETSFELGYEQQNGDNNQWLNADGTEVTFTYWDLNWNPPQPDSDDHACVRSNYADTTYWHDIPCETNFTGNDRYACRFETTTTADEQDSGCDGQSPFEISCDKSRNEDGRNFQILMNVECVQEKHPIIQGVGDFVNKYNTSRNGQKYRILKKYFILSTPQQESATTGSI